MMCKNVILYLVLGVIDLAIFLYYLIPIIKNRERYKPEPWPEEEQDPEKRKLLETEYQQACLDWRQRDKYVLDKLGTSGLLIGLIGIAFGTIGGESVLIKLSLLFIGGFFSFMLAISVAKDTYYRDASEQLVKSLAFRLGIPKHLQYLEPLHSKLYVDKVDGKEKKRLPTFPSKILIKRDESSIIIGRWLRDRLLNRQTFNWILAFYLGSCLVFINLFVLVILEWQFGFVLPV